MTIRSQGIAILVACVLVLVLGWQVITRLTASSNPPPHTTKQYTAPTPLPTYTEKDVFWHDEIKPYKAVIVAGLNKIVRENKRCKSVLSKLVLISDTRGSKDDPVFFFTCKTGNPDPVKAYFNVYFSASDIELGTTFEAQIHMDRNTAIIRCERHTRGQAIDPRSVDFPALGAAVTQYPDGRTKVVTSFKAKNLLGNVTQHRATCLFDRNSLVDAWIN